LEPPDADTGDEGETSSQGSLIESSLPDYVVAQFAVVDAAEPHEVPVSVMSPILRRIIEIEGPVHQEEIARRVAALFGKQKAGARIAASVDRALGHLKSTVPEILAEGGFWLTAETKRDIPLRNRSRAPLALRKATLLPPLEIEAAICRVLADNGALSREDLPRAVALLFGFQRTGPEFRPVVIPVIDAMVSSGRLSEGAAGLVLVEVQ
jgi:hypothetical protein